MSVRGNGGSIVNYEPNSHTGPTQDKSFAIKTVSTSGPISKKGFEKTGDIDMEQPRALWAKVMT
jgi:hypothetical protein